VGAILWKGIYGLFELFAGMALLFAGTTSRILMALTRSELAEDPGDALAHYIQAKAPPLIEHVPHFAGLYLITYGCVKLFLLWGLLRDRALVYRISAQILCLILCYQGYRILRFHSPLLAVLTFFDLIFLWMLWHEYRVRVPLQRVK